MPIELTPDQERRIEAIVNAGVYPSAKEALDAAVAAVEIAAAPGVEGSAEELEALLVEGTDGKALSEDESWTSVDRETDAMLAAYGSGRGA